MTTSYAHPETRAAFSPSAVSAVIRDLLSATPMQTRINWLRAIATLVTDQREDLSNEMEQILGTTPFDPLHNPLKGLTIGEVGVCYEALTALSDANSRKAAGQYFTPDDAAQFMAQHSTGFPEGIWLDPCCGVGTLAWYLAKAQTDRASFVRDRLVLMDIDKTALLSAVALIGAGYLDIGDVEGLRALHSRSIRRDFLTLTRLPDHDFVIVNPPYARTATLPSYKTKDSRELFAYFLERIATTSKGFISVTPAAYLSAPKFRVLREVVNNCGTGGRIYVFDNVPDTLFRGYKFGSTNTSSTNFVRAAITVCSPETTEWKITPIIRWRSASRPRVFSLAAELLCPRYIGPAEEWVKLAPGLEGLWEHLTQAPTALRDLIVQHETDYSLTVALTPRYFISAAFRNLRRGSKATLYFGNASDRDRAAIVLNSTIPYLWWRALDGGVTLPRRVLMSTPVPDFVDPDSAAALADELQETEEEHITTKLNAGKHNENVKRPREQVARLDEAVLGTVPDLTLLYTEDMAAKI
ncbi:hypothetical protein BJF89_10295 [Corynebacterium sp. CNJ-954]|uniref:N-6 DNA methylase n=1 Tax=Corynebacterium sp. CNJ-954 TaxID=1904962 RepID=UPI00095FB633|nr:N-6 DNA methylase [Corynebacterium sp. CNJ-954]OLT50295.1 hypothetical protein BJF89_10295 [Corynebacterium sp. CNJ-954]